MSDWRSAAAISQSARAAPRCIAEEPCRGASLEAVYRNERRELLHYLGRRVGRDLAPDLVQEVFVRALSSRQMDQLANPAAFVRRIARNLLIDRARLRATQPAVLYDVEDQVEVVQPPDQTTVIEAAELLRTYQQTLAALPDRTRHIFLLHRQEGVSYQQIAEAIGASIFTVQYHMAGALAACRASIAAHYAGAPNVISTPNDARHGGR